MMMEAAIILYRCAGDDMYASIDQFQEQITEKERKYKDYQKESEPLQIRRELYETNDKF